MAARKKKGKRDIEKSYPVGKFIGKLRRLADCLEKGKRFSIQVAGERVSVPAGAVISVEHERGAYEEELELQFKWQV